MSEDYKDNVQRDINRIEAISITSEKLKESLVNKLSLVVTDMSIDPNNDKPRDIEARMGIINSYVSLLDSYEKQARDTIKLKQKQQEIETNDSASELITAMLTKISNNSDAGPVVKDDTKLKSKVNEYNIELKDGELETIKVTGVDNDES